MKQRKPTPVRPAERWGLVALLGFTVLSVFGYWNFALHPERLVGMPMAASFYAISFKFFARAHIVISAVALLIILVGRSGLRWWAALGAVYVLSFLSEHVGTGYGLPFGEYAYTALLGAKLGGRVPALIPLSWFLMALPSWVLARKALPEAGQRGRRIVLGERTEEELEAALEVLPRGTQQVGFYSYGEISPYATGHCDLHNQTMTLTTITEE